jgi:argininosuccinate lyase
MRAERLVFQSKSHETSRSASVTAKSQPLDAKHADALPQKRRLQIRIGHHFASKLTDYGRGQGLKLQEIPFAEAQRIDEEQDQAKLPLTEPEFREVISAEFMVFGRKGLGGRRFKESPTQFQMQNSRLQT